MKKITLFTSILILAGLTLFVVSPEAHAALTAAQINQIEQILGKNSVHQSKIDKLRADAGVSTTTVADVPSGTTGVPFTGGSSCPLVVGSDGVARHDCTVDINSGSTGGGTHVNKPVFNRSLLKPGDRNDDVQKLQVALQDLGHFSHPQGATGFFGNTTVAAVQSFQRSQGLKDDAIVGRNTFARLGTALDAVGAAHHSMPTTHQSTTNTGSHSSSGSNPAGHSGSQSVHTATSRLPLSTELCPLVFNPDTGLATHTCDVEIKDQSKVGVFRDGLLKIGDKGFDTRQLQTHLKELGYLSTTTGEFDVTTDTAVKRFQRDRGVATDGLVGQATAKELYGEVLRKRGQARLEGSTTCPLVVDEATGLATHKCSSDPDPLFQSATDPALDRVACTFVKNPKTGEQKAFCSCDVQKGNSVSIFEPGNGQTFRAGTKEVINWNSCKETSVAGVTIALTDTQTGQTLLTRRAADDGNEVIEVPASVAGKSLKLTLTVLGPNDAPVSSDSVNLLGK